MGKLLKIAASQLGVKEITGSSHNMTIVNYAKEIGLTWVNDDETPWCGIFINWCLMKAGLKYLKSALARDGLKLGGPINENEARPGDLVIFYRGDKNGTFGHEAVFLGFSADGKVFCLGGNQGNEVSVAAYTKDKVLGYRRVEDSFQQSKSQE